MSRRDWHPSDVIRDPERLADLLSRAHRVAGEVPAARDIIMELCAALRAQGGDE